MPDLFGAPDADEIRLARFNADRRRKGLPQLSAHDAAERLRLLGVYEKTLDAGERERAAASIAKLDGTAPVPRRRLSDLLPKEPPVRVFRPGSRR